MHKQINTCAYNVCVGITCIRPTFLRTTVSALLWWGLQGGTVAGCRRISVLQAGLLLARCVPRNGNLLRSRAAEVTLKGNPGFRGFQENGGHWRAVTGGLIANQNRGWRGSNLFETMEVSIRLGCDGAGFSRCRKLGRRLVRREKAWTGGRLSL
eukprot:683723-Amorphochlora_amoeboformis.AAC.1